jgi:16S rRNA C967 or C1407 C5-methylase (RsmB/RsmF family)
LTEKRDQVFPQRDGVRRNARVYSVCTFPRAEGPDQVAALVARTGLRLVTEHRAWPPDADAFYIARLSTGFGEI